MNQNYEKAAEDFDKSLDGIRNKIETLENEINGLKGRAYEKVSESLKEFERQIEDNLAKRGEAISAEMNEWRDGISKLLGELNESAEEECRKIEHECGETLRQKKDAIDASFDEEVRRIKDAFDTLSGNIITQNERNGTSIKSLDEQLQNALEDAKRKVGSTLNTEISRLRLENTEKLKKHERDTENAIREAAIDINVRLNKITDMTNKSYNDIETYKAECMERLNELNASIEGLSKQTGEKIKSFEDFISESKNSIDEFFGKTDLIDKAIAVKKDVEQVKKDVEQKIDDLNADMDKLALREAELAELKVQFERANRMEEELNNKMTRFGIEQQRIERVDSNFNRLLKTSQSVEERMKYITDTDDKWQETQIKIRKLGEALVEAEEKYQRIEKKNNILEETNDGIDNNMKALQQLEADRRRLEADINDMRAQFETLVGENIKAGDTVQKLETLDKDIADIDRRMQELQKARMWLADLETRVDEKIREAQRQSKLTGDIEKKQSGSVADTEDAYSPKIRDNVITLKRKGWGIDEIGNSLNISRAAVELILETWHGDK
jgi:chromosome segregation ATPase